MSYFENTWRAPVVLRALTLRGIGSYFNGARLDIRPLTILCGANGSGKSTWVRVLDVLRQALDDGGVPFNLEGTPKRDGLSGRRWFGLLNAILLTELPDTASDDLEASYGPPGTIGLEFAVREPNCVARMNSEISLESQIAAFLETGQLEAGWNITVRLTLSSAMPNDTADEGLACAFDTGEIVLHDFGRLAIRPDREDVGRAAILLEVAKQAPVHLGYIRVDDDGRSATIEADASQSENPVATQLHRLPERMRGLARLAVASCFHIGPVREIHAYADVPAGEMERTRPGLWQSTSRDVGLRGEQTFALLSHFGKERLRQPTPPHHAILRREAYLIPPHVARAFLTTLATSQTQNQETSEAAPSLGHHLRNPSAIEPVNEFMQGKIRGHCPKRWDGDSRIYLEWLRGQIPRGLMIEITQALSDSATSDELLASLSARMMEALERSEAFLDDPDWSAAPVVERTWLLRRLLERCDCNALGPAQSYNVDFFVAFWLNRLVQAPIMLRFCDLANDVGRTFPSGFLLGDSWPATNEWGEAAAGESAAQLDRFLHPCFPYVDALPAPANFSAGFHQIAPIVVQTALMKEGECLFIDNPEVHLHPKLQLDLAEFLTHQALAGKILIVETHSDLIVRRVLRAILEETAPQSRVGIYFTSLKAVEGSTSRTSMLEPVKIDDRGRIANWPEGFLDDDVRESRRLIDAMYGRSPENAPDEEAGDAQDRTAGP